jgi:hypothetical protein
MKYCIKQLFPFFLLVLLTASCDTSTSTIKPVAKSPLKAAQHNSSVSPHKLADYFDESQKINNAPAITKFIQSAILEPANAEPLYSLGYLHMQSGIGTKNKRELELADIYLNEVLTKLPGNSAVLAALYNVYYESILRDYNVNAFDNALAIFTQLPESSKATMNPPSLAKFVATALQQEQNRELNIEALRNILLQAIQESPLADTSYIHLAKLYRDDRYFSLALATLKLGAENIHTSADLYKAIADTYVKRAEVNGCSYEHTSDLENAAKYYQLAIPLKSDDQVLHAALSESFLDQNRNQLGLSEAKIALDLKSSSAALGLYAQNLSMLGYHTQAKLFLGQAVAEGYGAEHAGYHEIYMNMGDWKNAALGFNLYIKEREKFTVFDFIKNDIIAQQNNSKAVLPIDKVVANTSWEKALFNFWIGQSTDEELKKIAYTSCEKTEYFFYTGYRDLQKGKTAQAQEKFIAAVNQNTYRFIERPLAKYFLQH